MLEGKALILSTRKYTGEHRSRSWFLFLSTFFLLVLAYAGAIANVHIVPQMVCSVLAGLISVRMFIIYHDYMHKSILQGSTLAKIIFTIFGLYILAPVSIWKRSHDYHHAHNSKLYTSSIGSFPLVTRSEFLNASAMERRIYLFVRHPVTIALGYVFVFLWGMCLRSFVKNPRRHLDSILAILFHFSIGGVIYYYFGVQGFLLGFLFPSMLSSAMGAYLFYAQHNFPGAKYRTKEEWSYEFAALHSSSYMKMSKLMHWFTGNIGYHHVHHLNARIPFYRLPEVFEAMPELQSASTTSLSPIEIYRCLRLKVWDPDREKMLGMKEILEPAH